MSKLSIIFITALVVLLAFAAYAFGQSVTTPFGPGMMGNPGTVPNGEGGTYQMGPGMMGTPGDGTTPYGPGMMGNGNWQEMHNKMQNGDWQSMHDACQKYWNEAGQDQAAPSTDSAPTAPTSART